VRFGVTVNRAWNHAACGNANGSVRALAIHREAVAIDRFAPLFYPFKRKLPPTLSFLYCTADQFCYCFCRGARSLWVSVMQTPAAFALKADIRGPKTRQRVILARIIVLAGIAATVGWLSLLAFGAIWIAFDLAKFVAA